MTEWERLIVKAFTTRVLPAGKQELRLRALHVFPAFDTAAPDEKESFLEAAESLEKQGLLILRWEKRGMGERLKTITCPDLEKLFVYAGEPSPAVELEAVKKLFVSNQDEAIRLVAACIGPGDIARGITTNTALDFIAAAELLTRQPDLVRTMTLRALSIKLYSDSKRLESILSAFSPLIERASTENSKLTVLAALKRSFPETWIAGRLVFSFLESETISNTTGSAIGLPYQQIVKLLKIEPLSAKKTPKVLTVENKETFYALAASMLGNFDCVLYTSGYPNQAAAALIRVLAVSGFSFHHAGDLDPDGILIIQNIAETIAECDLLASATQIKPFKMDVDTFNQYKSFAKKLPPAILKQLGKIHKNTLNLPGIAELVDCIRTSGCGLEQEIIEY